MYIRSWHVFFVCKLFKAVGRLGATRGKRKFLWFVEAFLALTDLGLHVGGAEHIVEIPISSTSYFRVIHSAEITASVCFTANYLQHLLDHFLFFLFNGRDPQMSPYKGPSIYK